MERVADLQERERVEALEAHVERLLYCPAPPLGHGPRIVLGAGMGGAGTVIGVHVVSNVGLYIRRFC